MLATPLQMALVAATIANKGVEPKPYLVQKIVAPDGSTVAKTTPQTLGRAIKPRDGRGAEPDDAARRPGRHRHGGADPGRRGRRQDRNRGDGVGDVYNAWFVCFAPANNPRYVVAVVVEKQPNGFGGSISAPIAKAILEKLLHR